MKMKTKSLMIILTMILLVLTAACSADSLEEPNDESLKVIGPALVMFYTDN
jgi:hypothetical protein